MLKVFVIISLLTPNGDIIVHQKIEKDSMSSCLIHLSMMTHSSEVKTQAQIIKNNGNSAVVGCVTEVL